MELRESSKDWKNRCGIGESLEQVMVEKTCRRPTEGTGGRLRVVAQRIPQQGGGAVYFQKCYVSVMADRW